MRCRPRDLAIVVSAHHVGNIGKVVHVLQTRGLAVQGVRCRAGLSMIEPGRNRRYC